MTSPDRLEAQFERERNELAEAIHKKVNSPVQRRTVPFLVGDAERAVAAVIEAGWIPERAAQSPAGTVLPDPCPQSDTPSVGVSHNSWITDTRHDGTHSPSRCMVCSADLTPTITEE